MLIKIRVNKGRRVRDSGTGEVLEESNIYSVEDSMHWRRRLQSKDVFEVADKSKAKSTKPAAGSNKSVSKQTDAVGDDSGSHQEPESKTGDDAANTAPLQETIEPTVKSNAKSEGKPKGK